MANLGKAISTDGEAIIMAVNDDGDALIQFSGGSRLTLRLSAEQVSAYRQGLLRERARAGTLGTTSLSDGWPIEGDEEHVIGDRNWFYC